MAAYRFRHPNRRDAEERIRPWDRRRYRKLNDEELLREVRGLVQVHRTVDRYRGEA